MIKASTQLRLLVSMFFDIKDLDSYDEINGVAYHSVSVQMSDLMASVLDDLKHQGTLEKLFA